MKRQVCVVWLSGMLLLAVACATVGSAKPSQALLLGTSSIEGYVVDPEGKPIAGALVELTGPPSFGKRETTTNRHGQYVLSQLPPASGLELRVKAKGFNEEYRKPIDLLSSTSLRVQFCCGRGMEFPVSYPGPMIDYKKTGGGALIQPTAKSLAPDGHPY